MKIAKIPQKYLGQRIDKFLDTRLKEQSRSQIQKLIKQKLVLVNDAPVTSHYSLKSGDIITVIQKEPIIDNPKIIQKTEDLPKIEIISETEEYIIINKPSNLTVHGAVHVKGKTLVDVLLAKYPELRQISEDPDRPAIVHRLDREASGLMVIPRTQDSFDNIKKQFQKRTVIKTYTALVFGKIAKQRDEINFPMARSSKGNRMAAMPETCKLEKNTLGKTAITEFSVLKKYINFTLIKVKIKTGRTHQVRCHLAAYGTPLVGDYLYGTAKTKAKNRRLNMKRVFLVADKLEFKDLKGNTVSHEIGLPKELEQLLEQIK